MYTGKKEFDSKFPHLDLLLSFVNMNEGAMKYGGRTSDNTIIEVECFMNHKECSNYFHQETVSELSDSDNVKVFVNGKTVLWIS